MKEIDMARRYGHNMEVEFIDNKDAFTIGYKSFLAGLEAGRPKWHKVADGDLPKDDEIVLFLDNDEELRIGVYNYPTEHWLNLYENYPIVKGVIAWCEIPTFDME